YGADEPGGNLHDLRSVTLAPITGTADVRTDTQRAGLVRDDYLNTTHSPNASTKCAVPDHAARRDLYRYGNVQRPRGCDIVPVR
ncbi:hypothetical protein, partial [Enhygromyxa salina]|uniref:hypothetical protein n=1 Tax=Enhygromyxa salina TaxID=215803 RepID=UPI00196A1665